MDLLQRGVHGGPNRVDNRLRVDPEHQDQAHQRREHPGLPAGEVTDAQVAGIVGLGDRLLPLAAAPAQGPQHALRERALHGALVDEQDVESRQDDPDGRQDGRHLVAGECAHEHEELADERRHPGQGQRRQADEQEAPGQQRRDLTPPAEGSRILRAAPGYEEADDEEQCPRGQAVVDHVQHGARAALGRQGERAEGDEAEVRDGRVGDEAFHVALAHREQRPIEDADHSEDEHERREVPRGLREQRDAVPDQSERADLVEDAHEQRGTAGGGFGTGIGQPRVERDQGRLDGEGKEEAPEEQLLHAGRDVQVEQRRVVERARRELLGGQHVEPDHCGQHDEPAEQAVQQELHGRVLPLRAAEGPDQEVHGDQNEFEQDVEQEQVGGCEHPDHARFQQQDQREECGHAPSASCLDLVCVVPGTQDDHRHHDGRQGDEHQGDAVRADLVRDAEVGNPRVLLDELEAGLALRERGTGNDRQHEFDQGDAQRRPLGEQRVVARQEQDADPAHERDEQEDREPAEVVHAALSSSRAPRATTAPPRMPTA